MARIKNEDLPVLEDLSPKETKGLFGGELCTIDAVPAATLLKDEKLSIVSETSDDPETDELAVFRT